MIFLISASYQVPVCLSQCIPQWTHFLVRFGSWCSIRYLCTAQKKVTISDRLLRRKIVNISSIYFSLWVSLCRQRSDYIRQLCFDFSTRLSLLPFAGFMVLSKFEREFGVDEWRLKVWLEIYFSGDGLPNNRTLAWTVRSDALSFTYRSEMELSTAAVYFFRTLWSSASVEYETTKNVHADLCWVCSRMTRSVSMYPVSFVLVAFLVLLMEHVRICIISLWVFASGRALS